MRVYKTFMGRYSHNRKGINQALILKFIRVRVGGDTNPGGVPWSVSSPTTCKKFSLKNVFFIAGFLCLLSACQSSDTTDQKSYTAVQKNEAKPNIILILSDDAGYADFGCYGGKEIPTPNIDALAKAGVRFTNAYVSASVCAPSRAGLLTGRYQQRFGFEHNMSGAPAEGFTKEDMGMDTAEKTIGDEMKAAGYRTIAIGKWHLGDDEKYFPLNRGFDEFYGFVGGHRSFFAYKEKPGREESLFDNREIVPEEKITYLTDMWTDKAISFMEKKEDKPFFIYLAYNAVHTPMDAKKDLLEKFPSIKDSGRRAAAAMMASLDENIGRLTQAIKQNNLDSNTVIIFLNDNGGATTNFSDNGPLRGMKGSKWEGGIRVGMIVNWKDKVPENSTYDQPVISLDILPTFLAAAGAKQSGSKKLDGVNLLPFITNENKAAPHEILYWRRGVAAAVREGKWKLIRVKSDPVLLFNLDEDISEKNNLAEKNPDVVKILLDKLSTWEKSLSEPHWGSSYGEENQIIKHRMSTTGREMEKLYP